MTRELVGIGYGNPDSGEAFAPILRQAVSTGIATENALLLDYCQDYAVQQGDRLPDRALAARDAIHEAVARGAALRWLDVAIRTDETDISPDLLWQQKIIRGLEQTRGLQSGEGQGCYVAVPALNEEKHVIELIDSFRAHPSEVPVAVLVADNNSTDGTAQAVKSRGGNVVPAPKPGIGPACQVAVDHIMARTVYDLKQTLIVRTDADCAAHPGYADAVAQAFEQDPDMLVGVGPSVYDVPQEDGTIVTIDKGQAYGDMFGTQGLRGYFAIADRDPDDYLLPGGRHRYLAGPNTTFRASLFQESNICFPNDRRWEMVDLAVKIQTAYSPSCIVRVEDQRMSVSSRAILGENPYLTSQRVEEIRRKGYVPVFSGSGGQTPYSTMRLVIDDIDRKTYGLGPEERVLALTTPDEARRHDEIRRVEARHAATRDPLGKIAIIGLSR
jgi:hypothetical protein